MVGHETAQKFFSRTSKSTFAFIQRLSLDNTPVPAAMEDQSALFGSRTWQIYQMLRSGNAKTIWEGLLYLMAAGVGEPGGVGLAGLLGESLGALLLPNPGEGRASASTGGREASMTSVVREDDGIPDREDTSGRREDPGARREEEQDESPQRDHATTP